MQKPKIFIGTPMYGGNCKGGYLQSMLGLQIELLKNGYLFDYGYLENESLITRARNKIVHMFLNTDYDYLLFIDSDHRFDPRDVIKMIECELDVISSIPPKKLINWESVAIAAKKGEKNLSLHSGHFVANFLSNTVSFKINEPAEVLRAGSGLILIKREVFEKMKPTKRFYQDDYSDDTIVEFFRTDVRNNVLLSEDYLFCEEWRELGGKVYIAPWLKITHIGSYEFSGSFQHQYRM